MKDLKAQIERSLDAKLKAFGREDKAEDRRMIESHETRLHGVKHRAAGGAIEGGMAKPRMDRKGGKKKDKKGGTTVNIVVANKDPSPAPGAGLGELPPMPKPPAPPPAMAPPPMPPMPPPGMGPGGPGGPGGPPMQMRAAGGRISEQEAMSEAGKAAGDKMAGRNSLAIRAAKAGAMMGGAEQRAAGGRLGMTAGAASGEGRLEKDAIQKRKG